MSNLLLPYHPSALLVSLRFGLIGLLGISAGVACVVTVGDDDWDGKGPEACYEHYEDCLDDAWPFGENAIGACEHLLDSCLEESGTEGDGDDDGSGSSGDDDGSNDDGSNDDGSNDDGSNDDGSNDDGSNDDGDVPRADDDGGDGDPETDTGETETTGDGDGPNPECFDLHAECVAAAQTIQDVEACEALFENCIDPGPCDEPGCEEPGCPQEDLDACVEGYAGCAASAETEGDVIACAAEFDLCIAQFDVSLCLPNYDDELVLECLEQHELCIACADDASEIDACKVTFDNCLEG